MMFHPQEGKVKASDLCWSLYCFCRDHRENENNTNAVPPKNWL